MTERIDAANVRRLTLHCRRCNREIGERRGAYAVFGEVRIKKRVEVQCNQCGHKWWENTQRDGYEGDVPRTSQG